MYGCKYSLAIASVVAIMISMVATVSVVDNIICMVAIASEAVVMIYIVALVSDVVHMICKVSTWEVVVMI